VRTALILERREDGKYFLRDREPFWGDLQLSVNKAPIVFLKWDAIQGNKAGWYAISAGLFRLTYN
jgi:hypothetical protein